MKKSIIFLVLQFFITTFIFAQPGPYSGILKFKVYKDGKIIDLSNKKWKVITGKYTPSEKQTPYKFPDFYQITPLQTPMGGIVFEDFYLDIIFKKDTMRIYTPSFHSSNVILDSIPFKKGTFKIPQHIYDLKYITNRKHEKYTPKINGDWELFKKNTYKCFIERVEDLDNISQLKNSSCNGEFDYILIPDRQYYYFKENVIIETNDDKNFNIYQIKDIIEVSFWNKSLKSNTFKIKNLFQKENILFAIIEKFYGTTTGTSYGIYKLHFIKDEVPTTIKNYLEIKQITEDYNTVVKFIERYPKHWAGYNLEQIKSEYEKKIKTIKTN